MLLNSNTANNEQENGHSRTTNHQHWSSANLVNHKPSSNETNKAGNVAQDVEQESLALVALRLVEHNRVLAGEGLSGNLLAEHGNHSNHGTLSIFLVEDL